MNPPAQVMSRAAARRTTLAALGLSKRRPARVEARHLNSLIERLGFFQIDSVNVLQRAHYMPAFSRLGAYDPELLHRAAQRSPRRLFEYWTHEAALTDVRLYSALRFRMEGADGMWRGPRKVAEDAPEFVAQVLRDVGERGPLTARQLDQFDGEKGLNWGWNWSETKSALEYLFYTGQISAAGRTSTFERLYDITERVIPDPHFSTPALGIEDAHRVLVAHAARALGVGTARCFRDYFRLKSAPVAQAIDDLVARGVLLPTTVKGWTDKAYVHAEATTPRSVKARALLSPFDPLVFERSRLAALFDFDYRIEIYTPAARRKYGYYVLPFLLGDSIVARVDLKADRAGSRLLVQSAFAEPHAPDDVAVHLLDELELLARWLHLDSVQPPERGDLAPVLTAEIAARS